jgi:hypothetical protein
VLITVRIFQGFLLFDEGPAAFFGDNRQPTALALVVSIISMLVNDAIMVCTLDMNSLKSHNRERSIVSGLFGAAPDWLLYSQCWRF